MTNKFTRKHFTFAAVLLYCAVAMTKEKPLALIYKGPGSCYQTRVTTGCSEASKHVAELAGFRTKYVGPDEEKDTLFKKAKVWIQPGGRVRTQAKHMNQKLKDNIVDFVANGGGYVGFCAGAFLATDIFGWDSSQDGPFETKGLGMVPGKSYLYTHYNKELNENLLAKIIPVKWFGKEKKIYWELGPYFTSESIDKNYEVVSYYDGPEKDKYILSLRGEYEKGKVFIIATHPEAPQDWRDYYKIKDPDGVDFQDAVDMIKWATK